MGMMGKAVGAAGALGGAAKGLVGAGKAAAGGGGGLMQSVANRTMGAQRSVQPPSQGMSAARTIASRLMSKRNMSRGR